MKAIIFSISISVILLLSACSGDDSGGSCIRNTIGSITACYNGWTAEECSDGTHSVNSCQDNGYSKSCPADGSNVFRLPSYSC